VAIRMLLNYELIWDFRHSMLVSHDQVESAPCVMSSSENSRHDSVTFHVADIILGAVIQLLRYQS